MQYPKYTKEDIEKAVKNGVRKSGRHEKRTAEGTKKNTTNTVYQPFSIVARSLFQCAQLTEFCDMMTTLAARELATCAEKEEDRRSKVAADDERQKRITWRRYMCDATQTKKRQVLKTISVSD